MNSEKLENTFQIVGPKNTFPKVTLVDPSNSGYLLFALEIDRRPPIGFFIESQLKKKILSKLKPSKSESMFLEFIIAAGIGTLSP